MKRIEDKSPPSLQLVPPSISFVDPSPFRIATGNYESQLEALFRRGRRLLSPLVTVLVVACNHRNANAMQKRRDYRNELTGDIFEYRINSLFNQHSRELSIWILRSSPPRIIIKSYRYRNRNQQASFVHYSAFFWHPCRSRLVSGALYGIADTARLAQSDRASEGCEFDPRGGLLVLRLAG